MSYSTRTMQAGDWLHLKHFSKKEFKYPDKMGYEFMLFLDDVREEADVPMTVTSSYRTPAHNKEVGGAKDSSHEDVPCNAADFGKRPRPDDPNWNYSRDRIVRAAMKLGCQRIGIYKDGSLHLDMTHDRRPAPRLWTAVDNPA